MRFEFSSSPSSLPMLNLGGQSRVRVVLAAATTSRLVNFHSTELPHHQHFCDTATVQPPLSKQEKISRTAKTMDEAQTDHLTQLLADEHLNTSGELRALVEPLPDTDRDSSTSVGPTGQPRFVGTGATTMSHHLTETPRPQDPHGSGADPEPEDPVHAVIHTVSFRFRGCANAVANTS